MQDALDGLAPVVFNSDRLREAARDSQLTQQQVAIELGMSMRAVQKWFLGESTPAGNRLVALARLTGRAPEWFFDIDLKREVA